jgi:hypothetical protein
VSPGNIMRYIILFSSEALFNTVHLATPLQVVFHCESAGIEMMNYCCHELYQIVSGASIASHGCRNNPDIFCYICGRYMVLKQ